MLGLKNFDFSQKRSKAAGEKVQVYDFSLGMAKGIEPRSEAQVLLLHLGIRLRYLVESWFFLKPLFASRHAMTKIVPNKSQLFAHTIG